MSMSTRLATLARAMRGSVIRPTDERYEGARRVWNGDIDRRPVAIACCEGTDDVRAAVRWAQDAGVEIAVRAGGHSFPGLSVADDALVIDLRLLNKVRQAGRKGIAVQGGAVLGELDRAAAAVGRAVPAGVVSHTGVSGLTLGGGYGYLSRRWGLTCDNLRTAELVTASGELITVSEHSDPELMWGLRGGGGNWGVVTEFEFDTYPLDSVLAGWILHPFERAAEFTAFFADFTAAMPRELCTLLRTKMQGNTPFLPAHLKGDDKTYIGVLVVWNGTAEAGAEALRPLREWATPVHDDVRVQPYPQVQSSLDGGARHGVGRYERAGYLSGIPAQGVQSALTALSDPPSVECEVSIFALGGAIGDVPDADTAYSSRSADHAFEVRTAWTDPVERAALVEWTKQTWAAIDAHAMPGVYVNLVMDEGRDRVRRLYGDEKYDRLRRLKARVDPDNVFHLNQNIEPAAAVGHPASK